MDWKPKPFWTLIGCAVLLPIIYFLVWITGGTHNALTHLFYIPIIFSALMGNWYASVTVALASGLLLSEWLMPRDTVNMIPQLTSAWVVRLVLFLVVSFWTSIVVGYLRKRTNQLYRETIELTRVQHAAVGALVDLAEMRDQEFTGLHSRRLGSYANVLCAELALNARLHRNIVDTISMHDIGKVAIPDRVLMKPSQLEHDEWEIIKRHPIYGEQILDSICAHAQATSESMVSYLNTAREIIANHHEKWDGSGYPRGLKGNDIPLSARVAALCDVYDSLRSRRPYKNPYSHQESVKIIQESKGTHFDPQVVEAFEVVHHKFASIWDELGEQSSAVRPA